MEVWEVETSIDSERSRGISWDRIAEITKIANSDFFWDTDLYQATFQHRGPNLVVPS